MAENMVENRTKYDTVITGFDKDGETVAGALGVVGKKMAPVEKSDRMHGGIHTNVECIPTRSLVYRTGLVVTKGGSSEEKAAAYKATTEQKEDLTTRLRGKNYQKLDSSPNITMIDGTASLQSPHMVEMKKDGRTFQVERGQIFINVGSSAFIPPIEGLKENLCVYTSGGLLNLTKFPPRLAIIGGGYIGVELSSIYASFGSKVIMLQDRNIFPPKEDEETAGAVRESLESRGICVITRAKVKTLKQAEGKVLVAADNGKEVQKLEAGAVLVTIGRRPNTAGLNLEAAGVEVGPRGGIVTDDPLTTMVPHIYAMGDTGGGLQFIYISLGDFRIAKSKVLGDGNYTLKEGGAAPYSIFLAPPFSRMGLSEKEVVEKGYKVRVARPATVATPKAQVLEQPAGPLKAIINEGTGLILGVHLFCQESYETINMIKLTTDAKVPYQVLRDIIYTHPTISEALNDLFVA